MKLFESKTPWIFFALSALGALALLPFLQTVPQLTESASEAVPPKAAVGITSISAMSPSTTTTTNPAPSGMATNEVAPFVIAAHKTTGAQDLNCHCDIHGETFDKLTYETAEECGPERAYLEEPLRKFAALDVNGIFTKPRNSAKDAARVPRKCFLFAMKYTLPPSFKTNPVFGVCQGRKPTKKMPKDYDRVNFKPCISEALVNVVYNSYLDATDCFNVPPKFAVAKFMNESGVIPNIVAANGDAGLSQFSTGALEILQEQYPKWAPQILTSDKKSCKNLLSFPGAMPGAADKVVADDNLKCHVIETPPNPVRNIIYYGAYYHIVRNDVERMFDRPQGVDKVTGKLDPNEKTVEELMHLAKIDTFDRDQIKEILNVMAYNTGPKAVIYFKEWLKYRAAKFHTTPITRDDFDMEINPEPWLPFQGKTARQLKIHYDRWGRRAMSFWEWLLVNKDRFRYASFVKFFGDRLDRNFGEGVCTPVPFLRLEE